MQLGLLNLARKPDNYVVMGGVEANIRPAKTFFRLHDPDVAEVPTVRSAQPFAQVLESVLDMVSFPAIGTGVGESQHPSLTGTPGEDFCGYAEVFPQTGAAKLLGVQLQEIPGFPVVDTGDKPSGCAAASGYGGGVHTATTARTCTSAASPSARPKMKPPPICPST